MIASWLALVPPLFQLAVLFGFAYNCFIASFSVACISTSSSVWLAYYCFMSFLQVDTNLESPNDIVPEGVPFTGSGYRIAPYSCILLKAKP